MPSNLFTGPHLIIFLVVIVLLFGAPKLPGLAKSLGQSMRIFKGEVKAMKEDGKESDAKSEPTVDNAAATPVSTAPSTPAETAPEPRPKQ